MTATGTVTVTVTGIADTPILEIQDPDPTDDPDSTLTDGQIDDVFRPDQITSGNANADRIYGCAGVDTAPFALDQRLRDAIIKSGEIDSSNLFASADPINGQMTEIAFGGGVFDGSETLYYIITGVDPSVSILGATPVDDSGTSFVVTANQLSQLQVVPTNVTQVTYCDMQISAIVVEDDQPMDGFSGTPEEILRQMNDLPGASVVTSDFTVVMVPKDGSGPTPCTPDQHLPIPTLELVGSGDEDTQFALKLKITPLPPFHDSIDDLVNLPNGVIGDFGQGIDLPPGASLSSDPSGAVLFDPVTGLWVIDIGALGVDPTDPTQTAGSILFTPPSHQSSPVNPFDPNETFGPDDPYDALDELQFSAILNNLTCGTSTSGSGAFSLLINPVADVPDIVLDSATSFDEDTTYDLDQPITSPDGGERPFQGVTIEIDAASGGQLLDADGNPLTGTDTGDGFVDYAVDYDDIPGLGIRTTANYSGPLTLKVTASTEDINGDTRSGTQVFILDVVPAADTPVIDFDTSVIDPETGLPFVDLGGPVPVITAIEDIPLFLDQFIDADSPDRDGSETISIVLSGVPDSLRVSGPAGAGLVDNGDGTYTNSRAEFPQVTLVLKDAHARTPDSLDPSLPSEIPLTLTVNSLELANSDEATGSQDFSLRVRPDADKPMLSASATPTSGVEDDGRHYTLNLTGSTPDPHEKIHFEVTVPNGGTVFIDGIAQIPTAGIVAIPGGIGGRSSRRSDVLRNTSRDTVASTRRPTRSITWSRIHFRVASNAGATASPATSDRSVMSAAVGNTLSYTFKVKIGVASPNRLTIREASTTCMQSGQYRAATLQYQ